MNESNQYINNLFLQDDSTNIAIKHPHGMNNRNKLIVLF